MRRKRSQVWLVPLDTSRCPQLWRPQGKKWNPPKVCLECGVEIIYKNDGVEIMTSTAEKYGIKKGFYHLGFLLSFIDGKLGDEDAGK